MSVVGPTMIILAATEQNTRVVISNLHHTYAKPPVPHISRERVRVYKLKFARSLYDSITANRHKAPPSRRSFLEMAHSAVGKISLH
jgi:hypothetical protein